MRRISKILGILGLLLLFFITVMGGCKNSVLGTIDSISDPPVSVLVLEVNGTTLEPDGVFSFGEVPILSYQDITGKIKNNGDADLTLTGSSPLVLAGSDRFSITLQPELSVEAGGETSFTLRFLPSVTGEQNAVLTVESDDPDLGRMNVTLTGTGVDADIAVYRDTEEIQSGGTYSLGRSSKNETVDRVFTVKNEGTGTLDLETPVLSGDNPEVFSVTSVTPSSLGPDEEGTFTVSFTPTDFGAFSAELNLGSNDRDEADFGLLLDSMTLFEGVSVVDDTFGEYYEGRQCMVVSKWQGNFSGMERKPF